MPEASNKLAKITFSILAVTAPVGAAAYFKDHSITAAALAELVVFATAFIIKVWDKMETQYVDAVAKWASPTLEALITRYTTRYRRAIHFQHRTFDVKGLNTQGAVSLELDQVFVQLALNPEDPNNISSNPLRKPGNVAKQRREIWDFLKNSNFRHLVILGAPGSGKTTLLKHVAIALAGPRKQRPIKLLPALLYLRDLQTSIPDLTLAQAIRNSLPKRFQAPPGWVEKQLEANQFLVLLDGLDEVAEPAARNRTAEWVERQMKEYNETRFLITSRPKGYLSNPIQGVTVLDTKPFTWPQVEQFANNWYLATETVRAGKRDPGVEMEAMNGAKDLLRRLGSNAALTELAVNPLLLTMITTVHKECHSLPGRRVELYDEIFEVFLGKRKASKGLVLDLTPAQKRRVLEPLAWEMMVSNLRVIPSSDAEKAMSQALSLVDPGIKTEQFLANVRDDSGLVIEQESGRYAFAHLTFQEYLASTHAKSKSLQTDLLEHVNDPWWAETIRLYSAQNNASAILTACVNGPTPTVEAMALAIDCREEALEVDPTVRQIVEDVVMKGLESNEDRRRKIAAEVQLLRYIKGMTRVSEDQHCSSELVPNAIYELFLREQPGYSFHWPNDRFPVGEALQPVHGIKFEEAIVFSEWLTEKEPSWRFEIPKEPLTHQLGCYWVREARTARSHDLPPQWRAVAIENLRSSPLDVRNADLDLSRYLGFDFKTAFGFDLDLDRAPDLDLARHLARDLDRARDLDLILDRARDLDLARARALALDLAGARALAFGLEREIAGALERDLAGARDLAHALDRSRVLGHALDSFLDSDLHHARDVAFDLVSLLPRNLKALEIAGLIGKASASLMKPGSETAKKLSEIVVSLYVELLEEKGEIPRRPVGIALIRTRV